MTHGAAVQDKPLFYSLNVKLKRQRNKTRGVNKLRKPAINDDYNSCTPMSFKSKSLCEVPDVYTSLVGN